MKKNWDKSTSYEGKYSFENVSIDEYIPDQVSNSVKSENFAENNTTYSVIDTNTIAAQINKHKYQTILSTPDSLRKTKVNNAQFKVLQKWEGVVEEKFEHSFLAKLIDITNGGKDEEVELEYDEISTDDLPLIKVGAIFYWSIGYETTHYGQVKRSSLIKFRRMPAIDSETFDQLLDRSNDLNSKLKWD